jgi:hypothetical protein
MQVARVIMLCTFMCAVVLGCRDPEPPGAMLAYSVGGCAEESDVTRATGLGEVRIVSRGDGIHVEQSLNYVCCADIVVTLEQDENTIRLVERNDGEICRCVCEYDIEVEVSGLDPGAYEVEVWGVEYQDVHAPELLGHSLITL